MIKMTNRQWDNCEFPQLADIANSNNGSSVINDPKLPHLATVMDINEMAGHFDQYLHAAGLDTQLKVKQCAIELVYYRPARHCGVLYRLTFRNHSGAEVDEWFFGRMLPRGYEDRQFEKAISAVKLIRPARDFLRPVPPVSFWPDLNMILWIFPHDPQLVTLPFVVEPAFVRQQVEANLPAFGVRESEFAAGSKAWFCTDIRYDRVKYMPGKRCVLRYKVKIARSADESREVTFYSKIYNDGMSRYHFEFLKSAREQLVAQAAAVNIPRLLGHFAGNNTSWQEEWKGKAPLEVLEQIDGDDLFPRIASMLASFHGSRINGLRPGPDLDEVLMTATEDGAKLSYRLPQYQPLVTTILEHLNKAKNALEKQKMPMVPIHGACRLEQMLVRDTEVALVDFDSLASGDPLYDIAEFIASLQYLEFSQAKSREALSKARELFLESYARQVKWPCDRRRLAWYVLAFWMGKMYNSFKRLDIPALQRLESNSQQFIYGWLESI